MLLRDAWKIIGLHLELAHTSNRNQISLIMDNLSGAPQTLELPNTILQPMDDLCRPEYQRLFVLGGDLAPSVISLRPRENSMVRLATVCVDEMLKDPVIGLDFGISPSVPSRDLQHLARHWNRPVARPTLRDLQLVAHNKMETLS